MKFSQKMAVPGPSFFGKGTEAKNESAELNEQVWFEYEILIKRDQNYIIVVILQIVTENNVKSQSWRCGHAYENTITSVHLYFKAKCIYKKEKFCFRIISC